MTRYADLPGRFDATDPQWVRYFMRFPNALCRGATEALHADLSSLDTILVRGDDCVLTFNPKLTLSVQRLSAKVTNLPFSRDSKGWGVATALWTGRDGQQVIFSKGHAPAHHFIGRNRRAWVDGMKGWGEHIAEIEARFPDALGVVAMDANLKLQAEKNRARIEAFFPGFEFTWGTHSANRGTRNRSVIDGVLTKGFDVASTHVYLASAGFDHRPSSHDLTPKKVTPVTRGFAPFAVAKNIPPGSNDPSIVPRMAILHVAVSEGESLFDFFKNRSGGIESHFYIRRDGTVEQYRSIYFQADANLNANDFAVSIETQGMGPGKWTDAQLASIKRLLTWLHTEADVPLVKVDRWNGSGVGYHSQFPQWSPVAKSCPGPDRIKQFNDVLVPWMSPPEPTPMEQARVLLAGSLSKRSKVVRAQIRAALALLPKR